MGVAVCDDLIALKSDKSKLYLMVDDNFRQGNYKDNNTIMVLASQGFAGGAFSLLCRITVVDGMIHWAGTSKCAEYRLGDPDAIKKVVARIIKHWPQHLVKMGEHSIELKGGR